MFQDWTISVYCRHTAWPRERVCPERSYLIAVRFRPLLAPLGASQRFGKPPSRNARRRLNSSLLK